MTDLETHTEQEGQQEISGSDLMRILRVFLNDQWKQELGMKEAINVLHPDAEMDCYRMHETNMLRYEQLYKLLNQAEKYRKALERVQVWNEKGRDGLLPHDWPFKNGALMRPNDIINEVLRT